MILEYQKLGDVADFIRGITYKPNDLIENFSEGSTVCMRTANVQVQLKQDDLLSVPVSLVKNKDKFLIEGDILVSTANSWNLVGKCCWIPKLDYSATAGGFISILRANQEKLDQRYLYHWFNSPNTQLLARNCGRQTTNISNMDLDRCLSMKIPLPPLPEQRRIASILDKADELRQKRQQAIEKLDQLLQATFIDMFGDPVSNPKGWDKVEVGKVTTCIVPSRDKPKSFTGITPWITTDDLNSLGYTSQSKKQMGLTQAEIDDVRAKVIPCRSVVMSCVGNLGITSIANNEFVMNQQLHSYQCFEQITPEFLMFCLPFEKNYMFSRATSTTLPYMNKSVCNSVPVILPPMDLQEKWSKILLSIEYQKQKLYKQLDIQNQLFSSLQNQAFSGTL